MNHDAAVQAINQTFDSAFDESRFEGLVANLLNQVDRSRAFASRHGAYIPQAFQGHVRQYKRPFVYYDPNGERLDVLVVRLYRESSLERARTMQRNFIAHYLRQDHNEPVEAVLAAFYHDDVADWRFSLVRLEYAFGDEGLEERLTPARRYSFLVGATEPTHTAVQQLLPFLLNDAVNPTLAQLAQAFKVEAVSKQFFEGYKELFLKLRAALEEALAADRQAAADFRRAGVDLPGFAKKLLGQIVFLYFVQKKGWLGVAADQLWGSGPRDFVRRLYDRANGFVYDSFFNDVLEPLFYDALALQRAGDGFRFGDRTVKIPFLNGGLFEPMGGYDWRHTHLALPNALFSNRRDPQDDQGTGILDVFDRYNFTVWEEEPLEKEVAVDPEMLGKVFENMLEVQDRKSRGAFYTPREIVHYMCQESLIHYLDTALNMVEAGLAPEEPSQGQLFGDPPPKQQALTVPQRRESVPREEIAALVRRGALALQQDAAKEAGLLNGDYVLPASVRRHAAKLDAALAEIKLCDPAIGSGAFPVGMLHEIVQARLALDTQLKSGRTPYALKRHAIQQSIYGVDIDGGAVEIAKLRLWLSLVVDEES
ncbi:MAG: class I SAM-dependent DNA methyltransferase, partial [Anaerolineae bacterium]